MPEFKHAEQVQKFVEEVFEITKAVWAAQTRSKAAEGSDISESEFLALDYLARAKETVCVGDIQRHIDVLPAQMSRIVRSLEQKGDHPLIRCTINREDKRKIDVELTEAGTEAYRAYRQRKLGSIQRMIESVGEKDRGEFMRILRDMLRNVHKTPEGK